MYLKNIFNFFLNRKNEQLLEKFNKFNYLIYSILFYFVLAFILLWIFKFTDELIGLPSHKIYDYIKTNEWHNLILTILIIGPILEEIAFRLCLNFSPLNFSLSCGGLSYFINSTLFAGNNFLNPKIFMEFKILSILLIIYIVYRISLKYCSKLEIFWSTHKLKLVYFSMILFSLIHLNNLDNFTRKNLFLFPLLISPQLLIALFASFLRLKCGFEYAIYFHMIVNFFPLMLLLFVKYYG